MSFGEPEVSPIQYPIEFPIKVMGRNVQGFAEAVVAIVTTHAADFDATTLEIRPSRQNNYLSLTCTITARSREQLDALYSELSSHPMVSMVL